MKFTILGGNGFIGRNVAAHLTAKGHEVNVPARDVKQLKGQQLGHVIYAIGLTGDFRTRLHDTVDAHVSLLSWLMQNCRFDSLLYCSSTRVYGGLPATEVAKEDSRLSVIPNHDSVYDLSKLLGEALCLASDNPNIRVVRLSNVYGEGQSKATFLGSVLEEVAKTGSVVIGDNPASVKDYVSINDVAKLLEQISTGGKHRIYNVASGKNISCAEIAGCLEALNCRVSLSPAKNIRNFPPIDISRTAEEFSFNPSDLKEDIRILLNKERSNASK